MSLSRWECNSFLDRTFLSFLMQLFLGAWGFRCAGAQLLVVTDRGSKILLALSATLSLSTFTGHFPRRPPRGARGLRCLLTFSFPACLPARNRRQAPSSGVQLLLSSREICSSRPSPSSPPSRGQVPYWVKSRFAERLGSSSRESTAGGSCSPAGEQRPLEAQPAQQLEPWSRGAAGGGLTGRRVQGELGGRSLEPGARPARRGACSHR